MIKSVLLSQRLFYLSFLCLLFPFSLKAAELSGIVYHDLSTETLNQESALNPDNILDRKEFQFLLRGVLNMSTEFNPYASAVLKLEGKSLPASFSARTESEETDEIFIKELFVDFSGGFFNYRVGKQYSKWGSGNFFNPIDVVNLSRDPLASEDEAEGNPAMHLTVPLGSDFSFELLGIVKSEGKNEKANEIPIVSKLSFSLGDLSGFVFSLGEKERYPQSGANFDYTFSASNNLSGNLYTELLRKFQSKRSKVIQENSVYQLQSLEEKDYSSYVLGTKINWGFPESTVLDGFFMTLEFYHNDENWNEEDHKNYLAYLTQQRQASPLLFQSALAYYNSFENSKDYFYTHFGLENLMTDGLKLDMAYLQNLDDSSNIVIANATYVFAEDEALVGAKGQFYQGKDTSEFSNALADSEWTVYMELSF